MTLAVGIFLISLLLLFALWREFYLKPRRWMQRHGDGCYRSTKRAYQYFAKDSYTLKVSKELEL